MRPIDIGKAYNRITHLWTNDGFDRSNGIKQHQKAITFVKNRGSALDIGCGCTGRLIELLSKEGFTPLDLDVSTEIIKISHEKYPSFCFIHADICEYEISEKYDFITTWDSIWHIPLYEQKLVLTKIVNSSDVGDVFIFSLGGTVEEGFHIGNFMGPEVYYPSLGVNGFLKLFIKLGCAIEHLEFDQYPELHTYLIIEKT